MRSGPQTISPDPRDAEAPRLTAAARTLTAAQVRAIRTAMQIFVEEDLAFGRGKSAHRWCVRCEGERPAAGFIAYEGGDLCNECATLYEIARAQGLVLSPREFLVR
ncbi:MAG: hypothetical protein ACRDJE_26170 [Dehalococcoidia bacterium]